MNTIAYSISLIIFILAIWKSYDAVSWNFLQVSRCVNRAREAAKDHKPIKIQITIWIVTALFTIVGLVFMWLCFFMGFGVGSIVHHMLTN